MEAGFWNPSSPSLLSKAGWAWQEGVLGPRARLVQLCSVRESPGWEQPASSVLPAHSVVFDLGHPCLVWRGCPVSHRTLIDRS